MDKQENPNTFAADLRRLSRLKQGRHRGPVTTGVDFLAVQLRSSA
jgi:hypothetical protein